MLTTLILSGAVVGLVGLLGVSIRGRHQAATMDQLVRDAVDEQQRREREHRVEYRLDQRMDAVRQRLSRKVGVPRAFSLAVTEQVLKELSARGMG